MIGCVFREFIPNEDTLKPFDCGFPDLNGFLLEQDEDGPNASLATKQMLAVTYVVESEDTHDILAYFSLLHDKIERATAGKSEWNRLSRAVPNAKRRSSYPALKIGRLAVCKQARGNGLGRQILDFVNVLYLSKRRAGCRFITVDALREAEGFYEKCGFTRLIEPVDEDETVLMYFDLKSLE